MAEPNVVEAVQAMVALMRREVAEQQTCLREVTSRLAALAQRAREATVQQTTNAQRDAKVKTEHADGST